LFGREKETLMNILLRYSYFIEGIPVTHVKTSEMRIDLIDLIKLFKRRLYRLSLTERQIVKDKIQELLDANIIRENNSPFTGPILLVKKMVQTQYVLIIENLMTI